MPTKPKPHRRRANNDKAGPIKGRYKRVSREKRVARAISSRDISALKDLARTGTGLCTTRLRRLAWPLLLNFHSIHSEKAHQTPHCDEGQVKLDLIRTSLPESPEYRYDDDETTKKKQAQLGEIIFDTLRNYPWLSYYQGFHELSLTYLLVFGNSVSATEATKMTALFFVRDAMASNLEIVMSQLELLYVLIREAAPDIYQIVKEDLDVPPFFAISWVLTWFAHDIDDFATICRLFDFLIVSNPIQVIYIAASIVISSKDEILSCENDFSAMHTTLAALPRKIKRWGDIIEYSHYLSIEYPETKLEHLSGCRLPRLSAVCTFEKTWMLLDPVRPLTFTELLSNTKNVKHGSHPLNVAASQSKSETKAKPADNKMAQVIDLTNTAQKARVLANQHKWPILVVTVASTTLLMYVWTFMQQIQQYN